MARRPNEIAVPLRPVQFLGAERCRMRSVETGVILEGVVVHLDFDCGTAEDLVHIYLSDEDAADLAAQILKGQA